MLTVWLCLASPAEMLLQQGLLAFRLTPVLNCASGWGNVSKEEPSGDWDGRVTLVFLHLVEVLVLHCLSAVRAPFCAFSLVLHISLEPSLLLQLAINKNVMVLKICIILTGLYMYVLFFCN